MAFALYEYETSNQMITTSLSDNIQADLKNTCEITEDRLKVWCTGLIEVTGTSTSNNSERKVQYLHRSVKDYLDQPAVWEKMISHTNSTVFDPSISLLRSFVIQSKAAIEPQTPAFASVSGYLKRAKLESTTIHTVLLDEVDNIMSSYLKPTWLGPPEHWISPYILGETTFYGRHTFLALAVQMRWYGYVEEKLGKDSNHVRKKLGRPLLDYALTIDAERIKQHSADQRMIRILFNHGALPSDHFDRPRGPTMWEKDRKSVV